MLSVITNLYIVAVGVHTDKCLDVDSCNLDTLVNIVWVAMCFDIVTYGMSHLFCTIWGNTSKWMGMAPASNIFIYFLLFTQIRKDDTDWNFKYYYSFCFVSTVVKLNAWMLYTKFENQYAGLRRTMGAHLERGEGW